MWNQWRWFSLKKKYMTNGGDINNRGSCSYWDFFNFLWFEFIINGEAGAEKVAVFSVGSAVCGNKRKVKPVRCGLESCGAEREAQRRKQKESTGWLVRGDFTFLKTQPCIGASGGEISGAETACYKVLQVEDSGRPAAGWFRRGLYSLRMGLICRVMDMIGGNERIGESYMINSMSMVVGSVSFYFFPVYIYKKKLPILYTFDQLTLFHRSLFIDI